MAEKRRKLTPVRVPGTGEYSRVVDLRRKSRTSQETTDELGAPDGAQAQNLLERELELTGAETIEEMRQVEGARLERAAQAIWPQVLQGDLAAVKMLVQVVRLKAHLYGLDVGREVAGETEAAPVLYQIDGGDPKRMEELTSEELATCIASLERDLEDDKPSQTPPETDSAANLAEPLAEGDIQENNRG